MVSRLLNLPLELANLPLEIVCHSHPPRGSNAVKHFRPIGACLRRTPFWRTKSAAKPLKDRTSLPPRPPKAVEAGAKCNRYRAVT